MSITEKKRIRACLKEDGEADVEFTNGSSWHIIYDDVTREAEISEDGEYLDFAESLTDLFDMIEEKEEE